MQIFTHAHIHKHINSKRRNEIAQSNVEQNWWFFTIYEKKKMISSQTKDKEFILKER